MRVYEVQPGDSPASIAAAHAGCPKCARDMIGVNAHKETVTYPNGFVTFKKFRAGEKINLPDKWWTKEFDELPPSYFAALPYADGVTPGKQHSKRKQRTLGVGAPPYSEALIAAARAADAALNVVNESGADYCNDVARVGSAVNSTVHAFKLAWNATESPKVPINTGNYEEPTAEAMRLVLGEAFEPCAVRGAATPRSTSRPALPQQTKNEFSTGAIVGTALVGAGAVATAIYLTTKPRPRRPRR